MGSFDSKCLQILIIVAPTPSIHPVFDVGLGWQIGQIAAGNGKWVGVEL
jgi:hypothetical protein